MISTFDVTTDQLHSLFYSLADGDGKPLSKRLHTLPSKKKHPLFFSLMSDPIDLQFIDRNINSGSYTSANQFDRDVLRVFQNALRFFGHHSEEGRAARTLRKTYNQIKPEYVDPLTDIVGPQEVKDFKFTITVDEEPPEDRIDCVCGQYKDEGLMIQCEKCQVWQHCDCVGHMGADETYFCSKCGGKTPCLDIPIVPQPEYASPGETYYVSLMRDDGMQLRVGDTVYVLRAFKNASTDSPSKSDNKDVVESGPQSLENGPKSASISEDREPKVISEKASENDQEKAPECPYDGDKKDQFSHGGIPHKMMSPLKGPSLEASSLAKGNYPTYKSAGDVSTDDMDIFRIERLWTNSDGERFAFGHHYLRPHETFHEPSRKFFSNEVFRVPIHEVLPLDSIWKQCWVLDIPTFTKGRPIGSVEEHVYICEYRVDKTARLFNKISKPKYPTCTKWFAFDYFDLKLKPQRTYTVSRAYA